jgi:hypothetical protein
MTDTPDQTSAPELNPCPFCGDPMEYWDGADAVRHSNPDADCILRMQAFHGATRWNRRADIPPTPDQIMADPRVQGLVEALERIAAHSESDAGLMECGTMGVARAALAAFRAEGGK